MVRNRHPKDLKNYLANAYSGVTTNKAISDDDICMHISNKDNHIKWWLATARKAEKDRETAGKEETSTMKEGGRTETAAEQEGT